MNFSLQRFFHGFLPQLILSLGLSNLVASAQAGLPIETWVASTGAKVVFVASPAIPMLDINLDFNAGSRYDPAGKAGTAAITVGLLERGVLAQAGQAALDEAQIADAFADTGGQFSTSVGGDRATVRIRTLSAPAERNATLALAARLLQQAAWPADVLAREKQRVISSLREAETKPEAIADKAFSKALYQGHPYGVTATVSSVTAIQREDLLRFYQAHYSAKQAVLTLIGAIDRSEAVQIAEQLTSHLPAAQTDAPLPAVQALTQAQELRIPHPATQAHILLGQPAVARDTPDYFPLLVGNYILGGGGFVSRLMHEVREKRGLVYGISSGFAPAAQPGPFQIGLQTKKAQTEEALQVVRQTLQTFIDAGPTAQELQAAKDNLINGFPMRIDSNRKLLDNLANMAWYGLPMDYLDTWTAQIDKVTQAQIQNAFRTHLQPAKMVTVIVGVEANPKDVAKP